MLRLVVPYRWTINCYIDLYKSSNLFLTAGKTEKKYFFKNNPSCTFILCKYLTQKIA